MVKSQFVLGMLVTLAVLVTDTSVSLCKHYLPGKYKIVVANNTCVSCSVNLYMNYSGVDDVLHVLRTRSRMRGPVASLLC